MFRWADHRNAASWAGRLRRRRFELLRRLVSPLPQPVTILDAGGDTEFWLRMHRTETLPSWRVVVLNLDESAAPGPAWVRPVIGSVCSLPFADRAFDVVFSNSVLEHVGDADARQRMADEIRRVGKRYFVQTPNRYFPIEPHFLFPFFQFLPLSIRAFLLTKMRLGWVPRKQSYQEAVSYVREVRLIGTADVRRLFPGAKIYRERVVGWVKSIVAYGGWDPSSKG